MAMNSRCPQRIINEAIRLLHNHTERLAINSAYCADAETIIERQIECRAAENNITELADLAKALPNKMKF